MENEKRSIYNPDGSLNHEAINEILAQRKAEEEDRQRNTLINSEIADIEHDGQERIYVITRVLYTDSWMQTEVSTTRYSRRTFDGAVAALKGELVDVFGTEVNPDDAYYLGDLENKGTDDEVAHSSWSWADDRSLSWDRRIPLLRLASDSLKCYAEFYVNVAYTK